ncbi:MAG TPA: hypothetical protein VII32_03910 [Thermoanaerobaculia bacterium]
MAKQHAAAALFFAVLAIVMTWPLAPNIKTAVAYPGDPFITTWVMDWDWYATFHQPLRLFDANIFYPARYSLAYSENLYGIAIFLFPFRAAGVTPIAAHNLAILGGFALSGLGAYWLGRLITGSAMAGITSGIFYAFLPYRFTHLPHVHYVWGWTLPVLLASLFWYSQKATWPRALLFGIAFLLTGLSNVHWLFFASIAIAVAFAIVRTRLLPIVVCGGGAALIVAVFLYPYYEASRTYGMQRSWDETMAFSARPSDWLVSNANNRVYDFLGKPDVDPERWLFPGALAIVLSGFAFATRDRKWLPIAASWIAIGFVGSLGLHTIFHRFLFSYVPGFRAIRVPARWAVIAYVGLAMLVAIGSALVARRRAWLSVVIAAAFIVELWSAPILWYIAIPDVPAVERWVAENRPRAIVELPVIPDLDYGTMLRATAHHVPMVNGYSGFFPPEYVRIQNLDAERSDELADELRRIGVSHIIVHADSVNAAGRAWIARAIASQKIAFQRRFDGGVFGDWLFTVGGRSQPSAELDAMLRGKPTRSQTTFGAFFSPPAGKQIGPETVMSGFAFSPNGIRSVNLLVNSGGKRLPTQLHEDPVLQRAFPWYPATTKPQFTAQFPKRPAGVWKKTDIQPEIIDGKGNRILLEDRFVIWP